jgi:hypothetical protein
MENIQNNWETTNIVLETPVKEHTIVSFEFKATKDLPIKDIIPSCGCVMPLYDINNKVLRTSFNSGSIPIHLSNQGFYTARKNISIVYQDGTSDLLSFSCKVEK